LIFGISRWEEEERKKEEKDDAQEEIDAAFTV